MICSMNRDMCSEGVNEYSPKINGQKIFVHTYNISNRGRKIFRPATMMSAIW